MALPDKLFLLIVVVSLGTSCATDEVKAPRWAAEIHQDTTFRASWAETYIDSAATIGNDLVLHPLSSYDDEAIRVRSQSGWGTFDAIATIIREEHCRIQMIYQSDYTYPRLGFMINEFRLAKEQCDTLFGYVNNDSFLSLPFDLEPGRTLIDGDVYSITYKGKKLKHVVTWQFFANDVMLDDPEIPDLLKEERLVAQKIYHDLFYYAQRPMPCVHLQTDTLLDGYFTYTAGIEDSYDYIDSVRFNCTNCTVEYSEDGLNTLIQKEKYNEYGSLERDISATLYTKEGSVFAADCVVFDARPF